MVAVNTIKSLIKLAGMFLNSDRKFLWNEKSALEHVFVI